MKLRNKKTGEIRDVIIFGDNFLIEAKDFPNDLTIVINSLADLNEEWEDYEESKDHWHIGCEGDIFIDNTERYLKSYSSIGNDFDSREEAEKAVEKLKAWKRLKDAGFGFIGKSIEYKEDKHFGSVFFEITVDILSIYDDVSYFNDDLYSLFGGEDE